MSFIGRGTSVFEHGIVPGMIHVEYMLKQSPKHGIGLFADQDLSKGSLVYTASPKLDLNISSNVFEGLDEKEKQELRWWGFWDDKHQVWHVDFDVSKFINHDLNATLTQDPTHDDAYLITTRDVNKGEELTQNYLEFESAEDLRARGI